MTLANATTGRTLAQTSVDLIANLQHSSGAYPASPDFSAYAGYCWFRDGAFIADGMSAANQIESSNRFFDWCSGILTRYQGTVDEIVDRARSERPVEGENMMPTRFRFDGSIGEEDWGNFQLDGYGTWVWAVVEHAKRHDLTLDRWGAGIVASCRYLASSWERPCWDWWEEHPENIHVSTLGCIGAGLVAGIESGLLDDQLSAQCADAIAGIRTLIEERGTHDGHLIKWLGSTEVDSSTLAIIAPLGFIDPSSPLAVNTVEAVRRDLEVAGGLYRFTADTFFGGGRWPLLSCFLGLCLARAGDAAGARTILDWAASTADASGQLPEQVSDLLLHPTGKALWTDKWGPVAKPLLWSHAMYLRLDAELDSTISPEVNR